MQLTYCGQSYTSSAQTSDVAAHKTQKLIYRGLSFDYQPTTAASLNDANTQIVQLIYRGLTFNQPIPSVVPYRKPSAINWRFQMILDQAAS